VLEPFGTVNVPNRSAEISTTALVFLKRHLTRHIHVDRETDRHTDRQTNKQTNQLTVSGVNYSAVYLTCT